MGARLRRPLAWLVACGCCLVVGTAVAEGTPRRIDLIRDVPTAGDLSAPANGQTLYVLDESTGGVVAVDPFEPTKRWTAVAAAAEATTITAIGSIDTGTLALVCRGPRGWSLRCQRVQPGVTATADEATQTVAFGGVPAADAPGQQAAVPAAHPAIAVSPSRDWLVVAGLPSPAAAVLRAPIAGARVGTISTRSCPQLPAGSLPTAVAVSAADEFVLFGRDPDAGDVAGVFVSFHHPPHPHRLLHLDTGLPRVHDAAFCRADGTLWVVGGVPGSTATPEGLWRVDAVLRHGRQDVRAVCVAPLDGAVALACLSDRAIAVTHGRPSRVVSLIDPAGDTPAKGDSPAKADRPAGGPAGATR
jgi:hypothetical protein